MRPPEDRNLKETSSSHNTRWKKIIHLVHQIVENYKRMADSVRSKVPTCKLAIANVVKRTDKNEINNNKKEKKSIFDFQNFV